MFLSDQTMKLLVESGLPADRLVAILQSLRADEEAARPVQTKGAARQAKYRAKKASEAVTDHNTVTPGDAEHNTASPAPLSRPLSPRTPLTPTHSPPECVSTRGRADADFERFWDAYPRKTEKVTARKAFPKAVGKASVETMIAALARQREWDQWRRGIVPHPATWLNRERWTDADPETQPEPRNAHERSHPNQRQTDRQANLATFERGADLAARLHRDP